MRGVAVGLMGLVLGMLIWAVAVESSPPPTPAPTAAPQARADHLVCPLAHFVRSETQISLQAGQGGPVPLWNISEGGWVALGEADLGDTGRWMGRGPVRQQCLVGGDRRRMVRGGDGEHRPPGHLGLDVRGVLRPVDGAGRRHAQR